MIAKKYRLTEREVKKVLHKGKPFFSYGIVLNYMKNNLSYNRFAIVIGSKSVKSNVCRNFFRRRFYDYIRNNFTFEGNYDFVFIVKKQTKFDKKDLESILGFEKDLNFLLTKINKGKNF